MRCQLCRLWRSSSRQGFPIPDGFPFESATAFLVQCLTAKNLTENVPFQSVLVHVAAGGVGSIALQLAKQKGATVIGLASKEKHDYLKVLGANYVFTYEAATLAENVKRVTDNKGADLILDTAGGDIGIGSLKAGGIGSILISYGTISGQLTIVYAHNLIFSG